jgi:hypothetical protein
MLANDISFEAISGLQTLLEALSKKVCKIVFIGNSVTAQKKGYRQYLSDLITQESKFQHNYINAGIGGVGSLASAFFVNDFVLRHRPDICFVECTVADIEGATPTHFIPDSIHGIIKKLKSQNIIICFLHLFNSNKSSIKVNHIISMYDGILAQYGVPSINIYQAFSKLIDSGEYRNDDLLFDGVHTTDFGARLTAKYIFDAFLNVCEFNVKLNSYPTASNRAHSILEFTEITKPDKCLVNASKNFSRNKFKNIISYIELKQDEFICFKVKEGALYGILLVIDQYSGVICIKYDSKQILVQTFDNWCDRERLQVLIFQEPISSNTSITITLSEFDSADRGANILPNNYIKKAESTKIVGLLNSIKNKPTELNLLW